MGNPALENDESKGWERGSSLKSPKSKYSQKHRCTTGPHVEVPEVCASSRDGRELEIADNYDIHLEISMVTDQAQGRASLLVVVSDCGKADLEESPESEVRSSFQWCGKRRFSLSVKSDAEHEIHQRPVNSIWRIGLCPVRPRCSFKVPILQRDTIRLAVLVDDTAVAFACVPSDVQRIRLSPWSELRDQDEPEMTKLMDPSNTHYTQACRGVFLANEHAKRVSAAPSRLSGTMVASGA